MSHLDPTYLRYIYDGLIKGSIHPENESELPEGLIGLYEESFEENTPIKPTREQNIIKLKTILNIIGSDEKFYDNNL